MRDGEADEDCKTRADDNEEGHQDAVEGWRLVGGLAGHCGAMVFSAGRGRGDMKRVWLTLCLFEWMLWRRGGFRGVVRVAGVARRSEPGIW